VKSDDKDQITAKTTALTEASAKIAEKLYASADAGATDAGADAASSKPEDDVVDAEFEEVKDDEKK
jgi:molecular chaperone DnaK